MKHCGNITNVLKDIKKESFVEGYKATDEEALGLLVSRYTEHDGISILEVAIIALTDANFHKAARHVGVLRDAELMELDSGITL